MALMLLVELFGDAGRAWLRYDRAAIEAGQWWRLLSGNFAHLGWYHWALNTLGMIVLVLLCPEPLSPLVWARRTLLLSIGMTLGLFFFVPELRSYVGMSGVIHGFFVLGLMPQVLKKDLIALGCLAYLLGKIGWEMIHGAPVSDQEALGGSVVLESHLFGSVAAFLYGLAFRTFWRPERIGRQRKGEA
ncbi:MAG TPA: rhombosortase [Solimonas sp.]|nr:rhombosortase [Solimonas sp.]